MAPKRYSIYPSPTLDRFFSERMPEGADDTGLRSRSSLVSAVADRYSEIIRRAMPELAMDEWMAIFDVLNGYWSQDNAALAAGGLQAQIADAAVMDGLGEKWNLDAIGLARRVSRMGFSERVSILDTAERFWAFFGGSAAEKDEIAKALGLRLSEKRTKPSNAFELTVLRASELAYDEDDDQVIGRIDGQWQIAHTEDLGRQNEMALPRFIVRSDGLDAQDVMDALDRAGIEGKKHMDDDMSVFWMFRLDEHTRIRIDGPIVEIVTE